MEPTLKQYGVWKEEPNSPDLPYWMLFDSIEDAVSSEGESEVYEFTAKPIGTYKAKSVLVKSRKSKKK